MRTDIGSTLRAIQAIKRDNLRSGAYYQTTQVALREHRHAHALHYYDDTELHEWTIVLRDGTEVPVVVSVDILPDKYGDHDVMEPGDLGDIVEWLHRAGMAKGPALERARAIRSAQEDMATRIREAGFIGVQVSVWADEDRDAACDSATSIAGCIAHSSCWGVEATTEGFEYAQTDLAGEVWGEALGEARSILQALQARHDKRTMARALVRGIPFVGAS